MKRRYVFYDGVYYSVPYSLVMKSVRVNKKLYNYVRMFYKGSFAEFVNSAMLEFVQDHCACSYVLSEFGSSAEKTDIQ